MNRHRDRPHRTVLASTSSLQLASQCSTPAQSEKAGNHDALSFRPRHIACAWLVAWASKAPPGAYRAPVALPRVQQPAPAPLIPRLILQLVHSRDRLDPRERPYVESWRSLNPEYAHLLLDEADCISFVNETAASHERSAYEAVITGAQKADLFRGFWLRAFGGIYADIDTEIVQPLRNFVTPNASVVTNFFWEFSFLAYSPSHPIIKTFVRRAVEEVLAQAMYARWVSQWKCKDSYSCVLHVTGPLQYDRSVLQSAWRAGCAALWLDLPRRSADCSEAHGQAMQNIHICPSKQYSDAVCGAVMHWDCRNSKRSNGCVHKSKHYSRVAHFYRTKMALNVKDMPSYEAKQ